MLRACCGAFETLNEEGCRAGFAPLFHVGDNPPEVIDLAETEVVMFEHGGFFAPPAEGKYAEVYEQNDSCIAVCVYAFSDGEESLCWSGQPSGLTQCVLGVAGLSLEECRTHVTSCWE